MYHIIHFTIISSLYMNINLNIYLELGYKNFQILILTIVSFIKIIK